jgi:hypothetical protein
MAALFQAFSLLPSGTTTMVLTPRLFHISKLAGACT